ncbi:hypothetical protein HMPREF0322_05425 [Desulfitobacterium hafniense DP7]|uniref:Uncharacterized protein n=1 Tax=Desulfitobacterium hafniense DP7 TaxID=537010 RepID=G9XWQ8_DESHA|nr:hypothetical protein HMPREF0322_05425 [Desulfitobacterium hafniense DP7]
MIGVWRGLPGCHTNTEKNQRRSPCVDPARPMGFAKAGISHAVSIFPSQQTGISSLNRKAGSIL